MKRVAGEDFFYLCVISSNTSGAWLEAPCVVMIAAAVAACVDGVTHLRFAGAFPVFFLAVYSSTARRRDPREEDETCRRLQLRPRLPRCQAFCAGHRRQLPASTPVRWLLPAPPPNAAVVTAAGRCSRHRWEGFFTLHHVDCDERRLGAAMEEEGGGRSGRGNQGGDGQGGSANGRAEMSLPPNLRKDTGHAWVWARTLVSTG